MGFTVSALAFLGFMAIEGGKPLPSSKADIIRRSLGYELDISMIAYDNQAVCGWLNHEPVMISVIDHSMLRRAYEVGRGKPAVVVCQQNGLRLDYWPWE